MYLKKLNQLSNTEKNISIIIKLTICFKNICKIQSKFSNIYIIIKIIYMYCKDTLLSNTEQMLK